MDVLGADLEDFNSISFLFLSSPSAAYSQTRRTKVVFYKKFSNVLCKELLEQGMIYISFDWFMVLQIAKKLHNWFTVLEDKQSAN